MNGKEMRESRERGHKRGERKKVRQRWGECSGERGYLRLVSPAQRDAS